MVQERVTAISYQAIFLDFDGVIVESPAIKIESLMALYKGHGRRVMEKVKAHIEASEGISRLVKIRHCHKEYLGVDLTEAELDRLGRRYTELVEDRVAACPMVAGAMELFEGCYKSVALFVVSGTPQEELRRIAERRGLTRYFKDVRGSPKGKAEILRELIAGHSIDPARALFVGDAMADYNASRECSVPFIGRVAPGRAGIFPDGTPTVGDLTELKVS
ncbi:MAG: HAD hydrolase-like protein [Rhodospirillales bacterium]